MPPRKKSRAFTAPKDKKMWDSEKRNSTTSPLLQLPTEIRLRIWGFLLGYQTIHIHSLEMGPCNFGCHSSLMKFLAHNICVSPITEQMGHDLFRSEEYEKNATDLHPQEDLRISHNRHRNCSYVSGCETLHLDILQVCHQIYIEVSPILYSTNTWSFTNMAALDFFLRGRTKWEEVKREILPGRSAVQRRSLKKLQLRFSGRDFVLLFSYYVKWHSNKIYLTEFHPLDILYLDIDETLYFDIDDILCFDTNSPLIPYIPNQTCLHVPHINKLSVTYNRTDLDSICKMTWAERIAMAEKLRTGLLAVQECVEKEIQDRKISNAVKKKRREEDRKKVLAQLADTPGEADEYYW